MQGDKDWKAPGSRTTEQARDQPRVWQQPLPPERVPHLQGEPEQDPLPTPH